MNRKVCSLTFLTCILFFSCTKTNNPKNIESVTSNNYKITWQSDSSFIFLKGCNDKTINVQERKNKILITKTFLVDNNASKIQISNDTKAFEVNKKELLFHKDSFIYGGLDIEYSRHVSGFHYDTKKSSINLVKLVHVDGNDLDYFQNDSVYLKIDRCHFQNINIVSSSNMVGYIKKDTSKKILATLNLESYSTSSKNLTIQWAQLGNIDPGDLYRADIDECNVSDSSGIDCTDIKVLQLSGLTFESSRSKLILGRRKATYIGAVRLPEDKSSVHKTALLLHLFNIKDLEHIYFEYQYFTYIPGYQYLENKNYYSKIILSQKLQNNQEGLMDALIDSSKYEDEQHSVTSLIIPLKLWWNDYGYDKEKVISSVLELFCVICILNSLLFKRLLEAYGYTEIKRRYSVTKEYSNKYKRIGAFLALSLIYSGYLFFGIKFEINNLKLKSIGIALLLIGEYVLGIVSLAYIANFIITK